MNCAQHTDTVVAAYCCSCGKPLCEVCKRDVQGAIFCESCLAARVHAGGSYGGAICRRALPRIPVRSLRCFSDSFQGWAHFITASF